MPESPSAPDHSVPAIPAEADVLVMGSGAAGMAAAITLAHRGLKVVIIEKTEWVGGSTAISGGAVWIPCNRHMAGVGHTDSREDALTYLRATLGNNLRMDMIDAYLDHGPEMVDFMEENTEVRFVARPFSPDYQPELAGASTGGRTIDPAPFDGRRLGRHFARLRPPLGSFTAFGGMMVDRKAIANLVASYRSPKAFLASARLMTRHAMDRLRHPRGTRLLLGNALAGRLYKSALDLQIPVLTETALTEIVADGQGVTGAHLSRHGRTSYLKLRRAVVLCGGGSPNSRSWQVENLPAPTQHRSMAPEGNTGDGVGLARRLGAVVEDDLAAPAFFAPVSVLQKNGRTTVFPHLIMDRQKPGIIAVDQQGQRFVNEATSYHAFVQGMHAAPDGRAVPCHLVCDHAFIRKYGLGLARPFPYGLSRLIRAGYLKRSDTLDGLAERIGVPADALARSVEANNLAASRGEDPDFGRGASAYDRYLGDPEHGPNPCLGPIGKGPFYAVEVRPGDIGSAKGLMTDAHARVLDGTGTPIPGLYACGNDMSSVMRGNYPAAGITLGPALTFGFIAGNHIAQTQPSPRGTR